MITDTKKIRKMLLDGADEYDSMMLTQSASISLSSLARMCMTRGKLEVLGLVLDTHDFKYDAVDIEFYLRRATSLDCVDLLLEKRLIKNDRMSHMQRAGRNLLKNIHNENISILDKDEKKIKAIKMLYKHNIGDNNTPTHYLEYLETKDNMDLLIDKSANPKKVDMHHCLSLESVKLLYSLGADIHKIDNHGNNLIFHIQNKKAIDWFVEQGLDINHTNNYGLPPIRSVIDKCDNELILFMVSKGAKLSYFGNMSKSNTIMFDALESHSISTFRLLIELGARVDVFSSQGESLSDTVKNMLEICNYKDGFFKDVYETIKDEFALYEKEIIKNHMEDIVNQKINKKKISKI